MGSVGKGARDAVSGRQWLEAVAYKQSRGQVGGSSIARPAQPARAIRFLGNAVELAGPWLQRGGDGAAGKALRLGIQGCLP